MKKLAIIAISMLVLSQGVASADIFGTRQAGADRFGADGLAINPNTVVGVVGQLGDYLGVREGIFYDFQTEEMSNYLAATLYTLEDWNVSFSVGMLDTDGVASTVDYNIGALIPSQGVPIAELFEFWYVGAGLSYAKDDSTDDYEVGYGVSTQIKLTF